VELLIQYLTKKQGKFDFVMALGSSTSDEDVFKTLKAHSEQEQKVTLTQVSISNRNRL
jgi:predicted CopG family antitoxin